MKGTTRKINSRERGWLNDFDPLMKVGLALVKHVLTSLAKSVLVPLGLTIAVSGTDGAIKKIFFGPGMATMTVPKERMNEMMKIVKPPEEYDLLIKGFRGISENKAKEQKGDFLGMLLVVLGASSLGNILTGKGVIRTGEIVI